jgi:hypothetical protein
VEPPTRVVDNNDGVVGADEVNTSWIKDPPYGYNEKNPEYPPKIVYDLFTGVVLNMYVLAPEATGFIIRNMVLVDEYGNDNENA